MTKQPKRGGTLFRNMGTTGNAYTSGFDPHVLTAAYSGMMGLFYQNLIRYHPVTYQLEPEIAIKWEQPSETEYIFALAPGIKWHNKPPVNGRPLVAQDVVFALNRARSNEPRFINRSVLAPIDKIEAVGQGTVRVTTKEPDASTLAGIADLNIRILAPKVFERFGDKLGSAETAIGTGAFILQASDDASATVVRNPDYWKPGLPYLDSIRLINIIDAQSRFAAPFDARGAALLESRVDHTVGRRVGLPALLFAAVLRPGRSTGPVPRSIWDR